MKKVSDVLTSVYKINWTALNILECGANRNGDETSFFEPVNNCWYIEANYDDYEFLKKNRKNTLNYALSDKDGKINFTISSHLGNSSCEYLDEHLLELKKLNSSFIQTEVNSVCYQSLLKNLNLIFDVVVLDIEGHEKTVLKSFLNIEKNLLPKILVIECGYDWSERLDLLNQIGYKIDCYYFNNFYLSLDKIETDENNIKIFNNEWKNFIWNDKIIYLNNLI
jgi:FkbM family methyltransferase